MYDADSDGQTDLGLVTSAPFLSFTDVFMDASQPRFIELSFTAGSEDETIVDQKVKLPNWPSSDALIPVMFHYRCAKQFDFVFRRLESRGRAA